MNGFLSYAHNDYAAFVQFQPHLRAVERAFGMRFWSDKRIDAGYYWNAMIQNEIAESAIFVLLMSSAFMGSDYIFDNELPAIRERRRTVGALILPVVLEQCAWAWACGVLQAVPMHSGHLKPIANWRPRSNGFDCAREQMASAIQSYFGRAPTGFDWSVS